MNILRLLRRRLGTLFGRSDEADDQDGAADAAGGLREGVEHVVKGARSAGEQVAEKGARHLETATDRASVWIRKGSESAREVARHAGGRIQAIWKPEDPGRILEESPLFEPLPDGTDRLAPELLSLQWRSEALLALSSAGVLSLEDEIIAHTDRLFHAGRPTPALSERIFDKDWSDLHRWIDTVPGRSAPGGGITHRVEHGHDLEAAAAVYDRHGLEGVLVWTQHVGQDVFSSTGLPLPVGAENLMEAMVEQGASRGNAALLVSFNAAELAAGFLAGTFALRLATLLKEARRRRKVKRRCSAAFRARQRGDLDAVIENYAEARSLGDDPALSLALGWVYRETGRPAAESFLEFRRAARKLASDDRMIEVHGAALSLRGLAYLLALVEAPQVLEREDLEGAWREELDRMVRGAVASFEVAAISQSERPAVNVGGQDLEWRPRPLSAAANYYLAARSVVAVPFTSATASIRRLRTRALQMLDRAEDDVGEGESDRLEAVGTRWRAALADDVKLLRGRAG